MPRRAFEGAQRIKRQMWSYHRRDPLVFLSFGGGNIVCPLSPSAASSLSNKEVAVLGRREFTGGLFAAISVYALVEAAHAAKALSGTSSIDARRWMAEQQQIAAELKAGTLSPGAWQSGVESLARAVDLQDLLKQTDFDRLKASFDFKDGMPSKRRVRFTKDQAVPALTYGLAFFGFRRGDVITPHGHRNMVSAHMVAAGAFRVRNFDRVRDEPSALIVRPTVDARMAGGAVSTMSSQKNNIHWFVAEEDDSATLDVIIDALQPGMDDYTIDLLDPLGGENLGDGTIRAPFINWEQSVAKYAQN
jgi:hypothetical protein